MSAVTAPQRHSMARGETNSIEIDWGENTAGEESGVLKAGDTVASCVVSVDARPTGALAPDDPTLGSVSAGATTSYVNGRSCTAGEWTTVSIVTGASQTYGEYRLKFTATTTNSKVLPRFVCVVVEQPR